MSRTTVTIEDGLQGRLAQALKATDRRLNPLVNELLGDWVEAREQEQRREDLRKQFRKALGSPSHRADVEALEVEWAEVDQEAADVDVGL